MANLTGTISVGFAWWVKCYVACLIIANHATGLQPNMDKVEHWLRKGIRTQTRYERT